MKRLASLILAVVLVGCAPAPAGFQTFEQFNVDAVFWHENDRYSVVVSNGDDVTPVDLSSIHKGRYDYKTGAKVVKDVPEGKPMYVKIYNYWDGDASRAYHEIHVHSIKDINTAGWNHGKFGSGSTVIIEN